MGDLVGQSLAHFRLVAKLGEGGMGVVYKATDEKLRRTVALKVLPEALASDDGRRRRLLREARAAAAVTHPNIASVYDVGEADGRVFIAMEYVEGETLRDRLRCGALAVPIALGIALQIARGLAKAHQANVVHRDLKPDNVMVGENDHVKLLDFGLAKLREDEAATPSALGAQDTIAELTRQGRLIGTPAYMSPEQARGTEVDARTDVFAFGVVLYEMVTGVRPFDGETTQDVLTAVTRDMPKPASTINPLISTDLESVIARCLEKHRDARYADGRELVDGLNAVLQEPRASASASASLRRPNEPTVSLLTPAASTVAPRGGARWPWALATLAVLAAGGAGLGYRARGWWSGPPETALSSVAPHPTTLADLPLPATTVAGALTEYTAGMQLLRDDSYAAAADHFHHAAELDPAMALAHLRFAVVGTGLDEERQQEIRSELAKALALRTQLGERDRALLDAIEPLIGRDEPDEATAVERLEAAVERFPLDEEFVALLADYVKSDATRGPTLARRATELDPSDATAWEVFGRSLALSGDLDGGTRALRRCAAVSVDSSDCYQVLARLDAEQGLCVEMEHDARREADLDPGSGSLQIAQAMVALDRPASVVREAVVRIVSSKPAEQQGYWQSLFDARLASLGGQFDLATKFLADGIEHLGSSPIRSGLDVNGYVAELRIRVFAEAGNETAARDAAHEFAERFDLWRQGRAGLGPYLWTLPVGGLPLDPRRREWVERQLKSPSGSGSLTWALGWAVPASTREDANEALAALAGNAKLALPRGGEGMMPRHASVDSAAGHVLLLAGKPSDAVPYLRRAAHNCLALTEPFEHLHASFDLGQALEATGDKPGACAAYKVVLTHWGNAKPRSVTAEKAREHAKALSCPQ
jgi:serine/threonine protein kinase/tetratricopeptide (TPR) repeat protein